MMTSSLELSFDCKPQIYSMLSKYFGDHKTDQNYIQDFLSRLEEERVKIDAFKRELPLCMQLLTNAMEASREELESQITKQDQAGPVLEEFIPLKTPTYSSLATDNPSNLSSDKANWMVSAQLWNQDTNPNETHDIKFDLNAKQRINGAVGAFLPFPSNDGNSSISAFPELALASSHKEEILETVSRRENSAGNCGNSKIYEKDTENTTQTQRKARRCWSPDLHRRFVNALHMLGGPQVATPKQIRELMKVDGLTNDEVKSHLQKYRLHTRSLCPSTQAAVAPPPQLVVLGGIWVPPEYAAHGGAPASAFYGANAAATPPPFSPTARPAPQENYHALMPPPKNQLFHHSFHPHQFHVYNKHPLAKRNGDMESDIGGGTAGNPSESIEAEKSESGSWKTGSGGENGVKGTRVEESNASFVSLHF